MLRRRTLLAAGALALLLAVAVLLASRRGLGPSAPATAADEPAPAVAGGAARERPLAIEPPVRLALPALPAAAPEPGGSFEGRVVSSADQAGIAGAELTFSRAGEATAVRAGPDGAFRFAPPRPGRWTLAAASAPGFLPFAPEWGHSPVLLDARPGARLRGVTVALAPAVEYRGRVVDRAGRPVAGAEVRVLGAAAGEAALLPLRDRYTSGAAGEFAFVAPEGAVLEARHAGYAPGREAVDFAVRVSRRLTLTLSPGEARAGEASIAGRVEDAAGSPASGAVVVARSQEDDGEPARQSTADAEGRFEVGGVPPGAWRLVASSPGLVPAVARGVAAGTRDVVLRLTEGGRIAGSVRDRATGTPVAPFTVAVRPRGRRGPLRTLSVVDPAGRYEIEGLPPGRAAVLVAAPGRAPSAEQEVVVPEPGAAPAVADFELSPGGRLRGEVRDARTRAPIAGAEIVIEGQVDLGPSLLPVRARAVSGPDGRFELSGVPDRLLSLQASAPDHHARLVAGLVVEEGEVRGPVVLDLTPLAPGEDPTLELTGIGAGLAPRRDALVVTSVLPQGGAAEVGLVPGDEIVRVDGRLVDDLTLGAAVNLIRGPENSSVVLGVRRKGDPARAEVRVVVPRRLVRNDRM
jgi:hypothetical protein